MSEFVEQRSAIKFSLRNEISVAETFRMLQKAFGDLTMSQKNVYSSVLLRMTSGYSPNSKDHSEDTVLRRLKRFKPNRRRL